MKICFMAPKSYQLFNTKVKSTFGGAEVQLSLLAKEYARKDLLDVHFMVADYGQDKKEVWDGVTVWNTFGKGMLGKIVGFLRTFHAVKADVYIQRSVPFSFFLALYCLLWKKKYVFMLSNDGETDGDNFQYYFLKKFLAR